jgi:hypothetical protein
VRLAGPGLGVQRVDEAVDILALDRAVRLAAQVFGHAHALKGRVEHGGSVHINIIQYQLPVFNSKLN